MLHHDGASDHIAWHDWFVSEQVRDVRDTRAAVLAWAFRGPLPAIHPFAQVRDAYVELARRKSRGKIVLAFDETIEEPIRPPKVPA